MKARALWVAGPGTAEIREEAGGPAGPDEVVVATRFSGISRGTEALVFRGGVPEGERGRMRAPLQGGAFPFPVKYGYAAVGRVVAGPVELVGREVFVLHPHQDRFVAPAAMAVPLPEGVPAGRAVLAANMETALNVVWDAGVAPGDRVAVIGAGVVGLLTGLFARQHGAANVVITNRTPHRLVAAQKLGLTALNETEIEPWRYCKEQWHYGPDDRGADIVFQCRAEAASLQMALRSLRPQGTVIDMSFYQEGAEEVRLGEEDDRSPVAPPDRAPPHGSPFRLRARL